MVFSANRQPGRLTVNSSIVISYNDTLLCLVTLTSLAIARDDHACMLIPTTTLQTPNKTIMIIGGDDETNRTTKDRKHETDCCHKSNGIINIPSGLESALVSLSPTSESSQLKRVNILELRVLECVCVCSSPWTNWPCHRDDDDDYDDCLFCLLRARAVSPVPAESCRVIVLINSERMLTKTDQVDDDNGRSHEYAIMS